MVGPFIKWLDAAEKYSFIPDDARPQGAKMEIPEQGVQTTCDATNLVLSQELPLDDGTYFLTLSKGLSELVKHHFEPKAIVKNGFFGFCGNLIFLLTTFLPR